MSSIDWSNLDVLAAVRAELRADEQQQQQQQQFQQQQQQQQFAQQQAAQWNPFAEPSNPVPHITMAPPQNVRLNQRRASVCSTTVPSSLFVLQPQQSDVPSFNAAPASQANPFEVSSATCFFDDPSANTPFGPSSNTLSVNSMQMMSTPKTPRRLPGGALPAPRTHLERDVNQAMPATELSLQCPVCGFAFPNAVALNSHVQTDHNILTPSKRQLILTKAAAGTSPGLSGSESDSDDDSSFMSPTTSSSTVTPRANGADDFWSFGSPGRRERDRASSVIDPPNFELDSQQSSTPQQDAPSVKDIPSFSSVEGGMKGSQSMCNLRSAGNPFLAPKIENPGNLTARGTGRDKDSPKRNVAGNKIMLGKKKLERKLEHGGTVHVAHFNGGRSSRPGICVSPFKGVVFPSAKRELSTEEKVIIVQSYVRRWLVRKEVKPELTRSKIVHELLETEKTYLKGLGDIMCTFVSPLQEALKRGKPIVAVEDVQLFAGEFQPIINFNTQFLAALKKRVGSWHYRACISDLFVALDNRVMIDTYARYTVMLNTVLDRFSMLRKTNSVFNKFVTTCEKSFWDEAHSGSSFQSFLILPIQRPPRYLLLLRELRKCTSSDHPDSVMLDYALENIERLCYQLNEKQRSRDDETSRQEEILTVAQKIDPPLVQLTDSSTRHFRKELDAHHLNAERKIVSSRHIFLFTDVLLLTKFRKRSGRYTLKNIISVSGAKVEDLVGPCEFLGNTFPAVMQIQSKEGLFMISFDSVTAKDEFIKEVKECQNYLELLDMEFE